MAAPARPAAQTAVYLEIGSQRVFACAIDWPGWCRSGKDEARALEALAAYAPRYAPVAAEAKVPFEAKATDAFKVVERLSGSATTDFGAPGEVASRDAAALTEKEAARIAALVAASWKHFDRAVAIAPAELRKGPRGGGRDRDAIVEHVLAAETAYARKLGIRLAQPVPGDTAALSAFRRAIVGSLGSTAGGNAGTKLWPRRYAARRIAWHALDHAWEIEDRSQQTELHRSTNRNTTILRSG